MPVGSEAYDSYKTLYKAEQYIEIEVLIFGTLDTYIWHIYSFILSLIKPKVIYTIRVNDRKLSEGEIRITNY